MDPPRGDLEKGCYRVRKDVIERGVEWRFMCWTKRSGP